MDLMDYSSKVVDQVTRQAVGKFWYGDRASAMKYITAYFPSWILDSFVLKHTGLDVIASEQQKAL
ncbi:hypothetical protein BGW36DRAFT_422413 [Talaromyces proteolyticus]|uniref:Uncharacterized protein n=1 Tax=Talaromyces proteolyticus TaxID=1131652 RepID=A0AAD4Q477_9EURO|nr:uncharacterized protein BGW36DRAFT_422413 [Talaromyces proteolyticus]KAH8705879.1 hypothetical protein BGW36DRAFT_422413 [Talaromyces proteolyticus]